MAIGVFRCVTNFRYRFLSPFQNFLFAGERFSPPRRKLEGEGGGKKEICRATLVFRNHVWEPGLSIKIVGNFVCNVADNLIFALVLQN
jgi:hypothetical protein